MPASLRKPKPKTSGFTLPSSKTAYIESRFRTGSRCRALSFWTLSHSAFWAKAGVTVRQSQTSADNGQPAYETAGNPVFVPAITYYEVLRELERLNAAAQIARLKTFCFADPNRFISLTTKHLEDAAKLWAQSRNAGIPTASPDALDGDVILSAQTLSLGLLSTDYVIATTNVVHIARFASTDHWTAVLPGF